MMMIMILMMIMNYDDNENWIYSVQTLFTKINSNLSKYKWRAARKDNSLLRLAALDIVNRLYSTVYQYASALFLLLLRNLC